MPTVSVIIPAFNAELYIGAAIQSVISQSFQDWDLIVVNDGSTDATPTIVSDFARRDPRIRLINQQNGKLAKARNSGIAAASGEFIAFLDADDVWVPDKLEKQVNAFYAHNVDVVFSDA